MAGSLWDKCVQQLQSDLPEQHFNTWIRPLQAIEEQTTLRLLAPNRFVVDWVRQNFLAQIEQIATSDGSARDVTLEVGTRGSAVESVAGPAETAPRS